MVRRRRQCVVVTPVRPDRQVAVGATDRQLAARQRLAIHRRYLDPRTRRQTQLARRLDRSRVRRRIVNRRRPVGRQPGLVDIQRLVRHQRRLRRARHLDRELRRRRVAVAVRDLVAEHLRRAVRRKARRVRHRVGVGSVRIQRQRAVHARNGHLRRHRTVRRRTIGAQLVVSKHVARRCRTVHALHGAGVAQGDWAIVTEDDLAADAELRDIGVAVGIGGRKNGIHLAPKIDVIVGIRSDLVAQGQVLSNADDAGKRVDGDRKRSLAIKLAAGGVDDAPNDDTIRLDRQVYVQPARGLQTGSGVRDTQRIGIWSIGRRSVAAVLDRSASNRDLSAAALGVADRSPRCLVRVGDIRVRADIAHAGENRRQISNVIRCLGTNRLIMNDRNAGREYRGLRSVVVDRHLDGAFDLVPIAVDDGQGELEINIVFGVGIGVFDTFIEASLELVGHDVAVLRRNTCDFDLDYRFDAAFTVDRANQLVLPVERKRHGQIVERSLQQAVKRRVVVEGNGPEQIARDVAVEVDDDRTGRHLGSTRRRKADRCQRENRCGYRRHGAANRDRRTGESVFTHSHRRCAQDRGNAIPRPVGQCQQVDIDERFDRRHAEAQRRRAKQVGDAERIRRRADIRRAGAETAAGVLDNRLGRAGIGAGGRLDHDTGQLLTEVP